MDKRGMKERLFRNGGVKWNKRQLPRVLKGENYWRWERHEGDRKGIH